jgi:hypothetical protein
MYRIKLSFYAKIFYIEWRLNPNNYRYNMVMDQILYGELDIARLRNALKRYIAEHVILNSHVEEINGEAYWVRNNSIVELEYAEDLKDSEVLAFAIRGFDVNQGQLYRFKLIKLEKKSIDLYWSSIISQ